MDIRGQPQTMCVIEDPVLAWFKWRRVQALALVGTACGVQWTPLAQHFSIS